MIVKMIYNSYAYMKHYYIHNHIYNKLITLLNLLDTNRAS